MSEKKIAPIVRFNGFINEWEKISLKEVMKINSGKDYKHLKSGDIPVYGTGGYMLSVNSKLSDKDAIGIGRKGTINKPQLLKAPFWTVDTLFFIHPLNKNDYYFIFSIMNKINWKKYDESTGVPSLSKATIEKINEFFPNSEEQIKIGKLFRKLDNTIILQQQLLNDHKQLKKAMLQKVFPQKGETVPKVMFANFTDNWNRIKLNSVLKERNIKQVPGERIPLVSFTVEDGVTPKTKRCEREFLVRTSNKKYKLTKYNDIVYNPANLKFGAISRNTFGTAVFSPIYITFETKYNPEFVELIVTNPNFTNRSLKYQEGTVYERKAVKPKDLLNVNISLPSKNEQKIIVNFFRELDSIINLYQNKLETYQELKKGMLQKMFV